jgi:hypothetical protein
MAGDGGIVAAGNRIVASASVVISALAETGVARTLLVGMGLASWARLVRGTCSCTSIASVRSIASVERTMAVTLLVALVRLGRHSTRQEDSVSGDAESSAAGAYEHPRLALSKLRHARVAD